jgi:plastocyanin
LFNSAAKVSLIAALVAAAAGVGHVAVTGDRSGYVLLLAAAAGWALVTVGNVLYAAPAPWSPVAAPQVDAHLPADTSDVARPSPWPLLSALAVGLMAVGLATGAGLTIVGAIALVVAALAWLAQAWQEHPAWTDAMTRRLNERIVLPFVLPATVVALIAVAVVSFSRVLLAVSATAAWVIALIVAAAILAALAWLATRDHMGAAALKVLAAFAGVLTVASGVAGAAAGEREFHPHAEGLHLRIVADDLEFNLPRLRAPAGAEVILELENHDEGVPHTFSVYTRAGGAPIFEGDEVTGEATHSYEFQAPAAEGRYWFQCDVHPREMFGIFEVEATDGDDH